jgi:hypothetical protein
MDLPDCPPLPPLVAEELDEPELPPFPPDTNTAAILDTPVGTVKVSDALYVANKEYVFVVVTELEAADAVDVPLALVAVTVNVYAVPDDNPVTTIGVDPDTATDPGEDVAVYAETAFPPVAPIVNGTDMLVFPGLPAVPIVGACGTVVAVALDALDASPVPAGLIAETL